MTWRAPNFANDLAEFERVDAPLYSGTYLMSAIPVADIRSAEPQYRRATPNQLYMYFGELSTLLEYTGCPDVCDIMHSESDVVTFPLTDQGRDALLAMADRTWHQFINIGYTPDMLGGYSFACMLEATKQHERVRELALLECRRQLEAVLIPQDCQSAEDPPMTVRARRATW
jgi:hypothetical protein